jgi:prepilin-type N-terminal cleavage/methylation domain-containing protein
VLTRRTPRGFTLIEVLVALALLLAGLAGAGIVLGQSIQYERESGSRRAALRLAASLADELRALDRDPMATIAAGAPAISEWEAITEASLPAGAIARVEIDGTVPPRYVIRIEWPVAGIGIQRVTLPVTT